ncbi:hypothetical protein GCM10007874_58190 [Labrys miyagiensis]|uniref:DUF2971 domain-containing protein n=1 Tax=Labrys miyagiensis TaxID=346912 RepID=A0ABQ6CVQ4_9HYPH|nr:DUF2971 domain-containing protein [Labrys miyagiensis]GLS22799.1 hypothetical protein GCM10007874_58190 [Labrys miyagiensis]
METPGLYENIYKELFSDISDEDEFANAKPLLAHYTSLSTLENILKNNEIWLSNPLFMNDLEEVRFGINNGLSAVFESSSLKDALSSEERQNIFNHAFSHYYKVFDDDGVMDTYILSLSLHKQGDNDGVLSMWRAYASNGNGAAIVFDTSKLQKDDGSPILIAPVKYASRQERLNWLDQLCNRTAAYLKSITVSDDQLYLAAYAIFERIKLFALFTKHDGFKEENEWRVAYVPERDTDKKFTPMLHYFNGPRGVEPKLKLRFGQPEGSPLAFNLNDIISNIILGPSTSSVLAGKSVERMLRAIGQQVLIPRLVASTIPLRPI